MPNPNLQPRRWTVITSGMLCGALALVVIFTNRHAFVSLRAMVVVAAIGLIAVLIQLRFHNRSETPVVHSPIWLNVMGIVMALAAIFSDRLHLRTDVGQVLALGAVGSFAVSSSVILHAFRRHRTASK